MLIFEYQNVSGKVIFTYNNVFSANVNMAAHAQVTLFGMDGPEMAKRASPSIYGRCLAAASMAAMVATRINRLRYLNM